ncbi:putative reverse transcriptase domain-containing protein [Tanacetum coccineum]
MVVMLSQTHPYVVSTKPQSTLGRWWLWWRRWSGDEVVVGLMFSEGCNNGGVDGVDGSVCRWWCGATVVVATATVAVAAIEGGEDLDGGGSGGGVGCGGGSDGGVGCGGGSGGGVGCGGGSDSGGRRRRRICQEREWGLDALMSMGRVFKTRLRRRGVKQSGGIDLEFKIVNEYSVLVNKIKIIMVNEIPPDHVDDVPVVEPNQHDDVPVDPEPVLVDEDEDPKEDEFEEEEDPQEEEDDMEPKDVNEVENPIESEDETVPASVHEVGESSTAPFLREDSDGLLPGLMRMDINSLFGQMASLSRRLCGRETAHALVEKKRKEKDKYYGKLILDLGKEVRSSVDQGTVAMEKVVEKLGNSKDKVDCKKLKGELEEARGFVFEERPNEAINVSIEDAKSQSIRPPKSAPMTQAAIRRMIKESVDAAIVAEQAGQANVRNDASGSGPISKCAKGKKVKFAAATLEGPALTWWNTKVASMGLETMNQMPWTDMKQLMTAEFCPIEEVQRMEHELWNLKVKEYDVVAYTQRFNELALMCPRMVEPERMKVDAYIQGLTDNIKGEVNSSKPADLNEAVPYAHS